MINSIVCDDVLLGLKKIPDESVHLIVCSPPYNVGIEYDGYSDDLSHSQYLSWTKQVWQECKRVLVSGGRICINIDATMNLDESEDALIERVHPLHVDFTNQLRELGYIYRAEIIWKKEHCPGSKTSWGSYTLCSNPHIRRNTEYVVMASKDSLRLDGDPMMCDLTKDEFHAWTLSEWRIQPETNNTSHPVKYPKELVKRCVKLLSYVGNTVLDPFCGSGTTTTTAIELGRNYIGIDQSKKYCETARRNAAQAKRMLEMEGGYQFIPAPIHVKQASDSKRKNERSKDLFD